MPSKKQNYNFLIQKHFYAQKAEVADMEEDPLRTKGLDLQNYLFQLVHFKKMKISNFLECTLTPRKEFILSDFK